MNNDSVYLGDLSNREDSVDLRKKLDELAKASGRVLSDEPLPDSPDRQSFDSVEELQGALEKEVKQLNRAGRRKKDNAARRQLKEG